MYFLPALLALSSMMIAGWLWVSCFLRLCDLDLRPAWSLSTEKANGYSKTHTHTRTHARTHTHTHTHTPKRVANTTSRHAKPQYSIP